MTKVEQCGTGCVPDTNCFTSVSPICDQHALCCGASVGRNKGTRQRRLTITMTTIQSCSVPGLRQYLPRCAHVSSQVQRQHRVCLHPELQGFTKSVHSAPLPDAIHLLTEAHVLPDTFQKHQIDKLVPVQALVKCKMQDNLEFLQWSKRFWDQYYPGGDYDAVARRKGAAVTGGPGAGAPRAAAGSAAARRVGGTTPSGGARLGVGKAVGGGAASAALQAENTQLKETVVGLERERDFYFSKLRDIELLVQQAVEEDPELEKQEDGLVKQIQLILYSTEEGFEIPAEGEEEEALDDQETF